MREEGRESPHILVVHRARVRGLEQRFDERESGPAPEVGTILRRMVFELEDGCKQRLVSIELRRGHEYAPPTASRRFERAILLARGTSLLATPID